MLDFFTTDLSVFEPYMGQSFSLLGATEEIEAGGQSTEIILLTLVQAKLLPKRSRPVSPRLPSREPFSLIWHGPAEYFLEQGRYNLVHPDPAIGLIEGLFLTPVGQDEHGIRYQSIFN